MTESATDARGRARELALILAVIAALLGVAGAVAWPWLQLARGEVGALARYAPSYDGWAALSVKASAAGQPQLWQSVNHRHLRTSEAYATEITAAQRGLIERLYAGPDEAQQADFVALTRDAQLIHERVTELDAAGAVTHTLNLLLRNPAGQHIVSLDVGRPANELSLDPPLLALPADLRAGKTWTSEGVIGGQAAYRYTGAVAAADPYQGPLGAADDCLQVDIAFAITIGEQPLVDRRWVDHYCAGLGLVGEVERDAGGAVLARWQSLSASTAGTERTAGGPPNAAALPPSTLAPDGDAVGDPGEWSVRRIGRVTGGVNTAATIAATYLPGERPALLVATYEGDLVALDATSTAGDVLWRFSPGGTVFGQPAVDPESGRIYFGASDKRLYALDGRGLFLWSFPTGDNVATRPALHRGGVFFGSEDRNAYALDAETGALRWQRQLGNAVVGAPAVVAGPAGDTAVAVFGADDGAAYGLDAETGAQRWRYETGNAVEAPILPLDGRVLVTSTAGTLSALDPLSGEEGWVADNGRPIRHAPAIAQDRLIVVDEQGFLNAFDRTTGRRLWQSLETDYYGTPRLVGDTVLVAGSAAVVHRLGLDGRRRGAWAMSAASDASDGSVRLDFGPALGGGAAWLIDGRSVIRRIGPPLAGPQGLPLAWSVGTNEPPFALDLLRAAPVALPRPGGQSELLLLDEGGRMVSVEPATGRVALLARAPLEAVRIEPALTGDVLIAASPTGLHAVRLSDGAGLWDAAGGTTVQPPVVAGDLVLWSTALGGDPPAARLSGLDVKTGAPRWQRDFAGVSIAGGLLVQGEAVFYTSPVSRLDLATGATRWEAAELTGGSGAPALSAAGDTLYVGRIDPVAGGAFAALDAETGAVRWQVNLGNEALSLLERPWVLDDLVILPGLGGTLLALDAGNGNVRWRMGVGDGGLPAPRFGALTVADGRLYTALQDGQMVVLDGRRGEIVARRGDREGGLASYGYAQRPAVVDGFVVMTFGSVLRGFDLREVQP